MCFSCLPHDIIPSELPDSNEILPFHRICPWASRQQIQFMFFKFPLQLRQTDVFPQTLWPTYNIAVENCGWSLISHKNAASFHSTLYIPSSTSSESRSYDWWVLTLQLGNILHGFIQQKSSCSGKTWISLRFPPWIAIPSSHPPTFAGLGTATQLNDFSGMDLATFDPQVRHTWCLPKLMTS